MLKLENYAFVTVDDGSGNIKAVTLSESGDLIKYIQPSSVSEEFTGYDGFPDFAWTVSGRTYFVTPHQKNSESTTSRDYQVSITNRVLVNDAIARLNIDKPIILAVTIPADQYYNLRNKHNPINHELIEQKKANLMGDIVNESGLLKRPNIVAIKVYPEAIPAYVACSHDEHGNKRADYDDIHSTVIVDLGHYTCDIAHFKNHFNIIDKKTTANGVHQFINEFKNEAISKGHSKMLTTYTDYTIIHAINRGYLGPTAEHRKDQRVSIKPITEAVINDYYNRIINDIKSAIKDEIETLDRLILVGGGASLIGDLAIKEYGNVVVIPDQPEFAIATGTHLMMIANAEAIINEINEPKKQAELAE